jgi:hypothetical protein
MESPLAERPQPNKPPQLPSQGDPNESGIFRWYQDLLDRIMPKKEKEQPK